MTSSLNIQIRRVTPPDVPAISALAREIWQATYPGIITQAVSYTHLTLPTIYSV